MTVSLRGFIFGVMIGAVVAVGAFLWAEPESEQLLLVAACGLVACCTLLDRKRCRCLQCGYKLAGHTSGVCPGCGTDVQAMRCTKCAYNLTGNESGVCPECGAKVD